MTSARQRSARLQGVVLVLLGAFLVLLAYRFLDWYDEPSRQSLDSSGRITFAKLQQSAGQLSNAGSANAYFGWLGWVLLIAMIIAGVAANLPFRPADACRVAGFIVGLLGLAATYFAVAQLHNAQVAAGAAKHSVFYNSNLGLWAALLGFLLGAVGAVLGPRSVAT